MEDLVNVNEKLAVCYPKALHKLDIEANKLVAAFCLQLTTDGQETQCSSQSHPSSLDLVIQYGDSCL